MQNLRKPEWLKIKINNNSDSFEVRDILKKYALNTVCEEANCPNRIECFNKKTATFIILGKVCTRNCTFCNIKKGAAENVNPGEPENIAVAVKKLGIKHIVITSVTRDDLPDGGAAHFAKVINAIKKNSGAVADVVADVVTIEVLIPDFLGSESSLKTVMDARPDVINHNVETVPVLYPSVRPNAVYKRSLELLKKIKQMDSSIFTKSGIMLGLGEKDEQIINVLFDLKKTGCDFITIGQYLAPSKEHHDVIKYYHPKEFEYFKSVAVKMGIRTVASGPFVRSSYNAKQMLDD